MKTSMSISALALLGALAPGLVMAASESTTGKASAKVVEPATIREDQSLNFGTMTNEMGVVTVSTSGQRFSTGDNLVNDVSNPPTTAMFTVSGPEGQFITVELPASGATISTSGGDSMVVDLVSAAYGTSGTFAVYVGGSVNPENKASGDYTGDYTITINY